MKSTDHPSKVDTLRLISEIKENVSGLKSVLWSQEELMANKEFLNSASQKIDETINLIAKNFYWYRKIGWKRFVRDPNQVDTKVLEEAKFEEKRRLQDWLTTSSSGYDFYYLFPRQIGEDLIHNTIVANGFTDPSSRTVLDIGCRDGYWLEKFHHLGIQPENLAGVEPNDDLKVLSEQNLDQRIQVVHHYPDELPFENQRFDVVLVFGTLMNILDDNLLQEVANELLRVLSQEGMILSFNASEQLLTGLDPYVSYATQVLSLQDMRTLFPGCHVQFLSGDTITLSVVTRVSRQREG